MHPSLFEIIARVALVVLVNGLWQGAAIAGLTWLALRVFPRVNASTRYAAWTVALVAVLVVPIATSLSRVSYEATAAPAAKTIQTTATNVPHTPALRLRDYEIYVAYGDPNTLSTIPQAIFKVIFYAGAQKGT